MKDFINTFKCLKRSVLVKKGCKNEIKNKTISLDLLLGALSILLAVLLAVRRGDKSAENFFSTLSLRYF